MISITIEKDSKGDYRKLNCFGHAEYDDFGQDTVCAAISMLVINTINAVETLTGISIDVRSDEETGLIDASFGCTDETVTDPEDEVSRIRSREDANLLIDAMILGIRSVQSDYGDGYVSLELLEVEQ